MMKNSSTTRAVRIHRSDIFVFFAFVFLFFMFLFCSSEFVYGEETVSIEESQADPISANNDILVKEKIPSSSAKESAVSVNGIAEKTAELSSATSHTDTFSEEVTPQDTGEINSEPVVAQNDLLTDAKITYSKTELLQNKLQEFGFLTNDFTYNSMDEATQNATILFQAYNSLPVTGICDEYTLAILNQEDIVPYSNICYGSKGNHVKYLQMLLQEKGFLTVRPDGIWGAYSTRAIKEFIYYAGILDETTDTISIELFRKVIDSNVRKNNAILSYGMENTEVRSIQQSLAQGGYLTGEVTDSLFDEATKNALFIFQKMNGLCPDGLVGIKTRSLFLQGFTPFHTIQMNEKGETVRWIQSLYRKTGFLPVSPDGWWGNRSRKAVEAFTFVDDQNPSSEPTIEVLLSLLKDGENHAINQIRPVNATDDSEMLKKVTARLYVLDFIDDLSVLLETTDEWNAQLKRYQLFTGLFPDGVCGPKTVSLLNVGTCSYKELQYGDRDIGVHSLQYALFQTGFFVGKPDSIFGERTRAAVDLLKTMNSLQGKAVRQADWDVLINIYSIVKQNDINIDSVYAYGSSGSPVRFIQKRLKELGYFNASEDGVFGKNTKHAVFLFQSAHGIYSDMCVGRVTFRSLFSKNVKQYVKTTRLGIDVSYAQENIDWTAVKNNGVEFAIIRAGFRGYGGTGSLNTDDYFLQNIKDATAVGIQCGIYFFTQAVNRSEGIEEARYVVDLLKDNNLLSAVTLPIAIDTEYSNGQANGRADGISVQARTEAIVGFCEEINTLGFTPMIYASPNWLGNKVDYGSLSKYKLWLAHWTGSPEKPSSYASDYPYVFWQYSSRGSVRGISGNVDMDIMNI